MRVAFTNTLVEDIANQTKVDLIRAGIESERIEIKKIEYFWVVFVTEFRNWSEVFEIEEKIESFHKT